MKGWVYVISNKAMPGLVKVGYSTKDPEHRAKELNHTGSPHPYLVDYESLIEEPYQIEQKTHKVLSKYREDKEWFRCSAEVAIAAIKQVAGTQRIIETYKRAERAKAEEILQKQFAEQEKKRTEKKKKDDVETLLLAEETKIKETYNQKFEQQFPPRLFRIYWGWGTVLVFIAFILFRGASWEIFFVSMFLGWIPGFFLQNYFEEEQKKSTPYLSLTSKREEDLLGVRERKATCQRCATNIRFERKIELIADPNTIWNCPNCKEPIISPYSPNKSKPIERNLSTSSKVIPTLISVPQQKSEDFGDAIFIVGAILFIWFFSTLSGNSTPANPAIDNSVARPVTAQVTSFSNQSNLSAPTSVSTPVSIHQKTPNILKRENKHAKPQKKKRSASDLRQCLSLQTNEAIVRCVEK
jgi:hypothetical protein